MKGHCIILCRLLQNQRTREAEVSSTALYRVQTTYYNMPRRAKICQMKLVKRTNRQQNIFQKIKVLPWRHIFLSTPYFHQCDHNDDECSVCRLNWGFSYSRHQWPVQLQKDPLLQQFPCSNHVRDKHNCLWDMAPSSKVNRQKLYGSSN